MYSLYSIIEPYRAAESPASSQLNETCFCCSSLSESKMELFSERDKLLSILLCKRDITEAA